MLISRRRGASSPSDGERDLRDLLVVAGWVGVGIVLTDTVTAGMPYGALGRAGVVVVTVIALLAWVTSLRRSITDVRIVLGLLLAVGLGGAWLNVLSPAGPGFLLAYMAMAGLGLRLPRRVALPAGLLVGAAVGIAQARTSSHPLASFLDIALGAGFLFIASAFAGVSRDAREQAQRLLEQEKATREAREQAAVLAERARLARELHDVLAHSLSGLAVQLEGARLLATKTGSHPRLVDQLTAAQRLARDGLVSARGAVSTLRGDGLPGPVEVPQLVAQARAAGHPTTYEVTGTPRPMAADTGLALYRTVQEALTNATKHGGPDSRVAVRVDWAGAQARAEVLNVAPPGPAAADAEGEVPGPPRPVLPSGGYGLAGLAERATLAGGHLEAGRTDEGWLVRLTLPIAGTDDAAAASSAIGREPGRPQPAPIR